jgi:alpha-L-arabinofuranosidase
LFLLVHAPAVADEPDSAYIRAYATARNNNKNGLHLAWSVDGERWHVIGNEHSFLRCDYGRWGAEKRMLNPRLARDAAGRWHCTWEVNERDRVFAHAASPDLVHWGRQSYRPEGERDAFLASLHLPASDPTGVTRVEWSVVDKVVKAWQHADYCSRLWSEQAKDDPARFAGLKKVEATITVDAADRKQISDRLVGVFFEDISRAADGGLYAELVQNRDFEYTPGDREGNDRGWNATKAWSLSDGRTPVIDTAAPLHPNNPHHVKLRGGDRLRNDGFDGIPVVAGKEYRFSAFARSSLDGMISIRLINPAGEAVSLGKTLAVKSAGWKKHDLLLTAEQTAYDARLEIIVAGVVDLDMISLFPRETFKGRPNGLRDDLARAVAALKPRFVRFPGGCVAHGDGLANMYRWKNTIGPLESRVPQRNIWGYHQTAGLGYFEYFQFCEDIGAEPVPIVPAGVPCQNSATGGAGQQGGIPLEEMDAYVQEVLDLIEWANGDPRTTWGRKRAEAGHPKPFNLKYLGVGNEDLISDIFEERFTMIFNAVKEKHPEITVIGTAGPSSEGADYREGWAIATKLGVPVVDEHYYQSPGWFIYNQDYYDRYDRAKSKVYLGEYAAHLPGRPNNLETALAEALYLTALERNGDVVVMSSYAPLLAREGYTNWNPNLIYFNNAGVTTTAGYLVQQLYGNNAGDEYITSDTRLNNADLKVKSRVACSVTRDSRTGDMIIKLVNLLPVEVSARARLENATPAGPVASTTLLTGRPDDRQPRAVTGTTAVGEEFALSLPPYSFTIVRFQTRNNNP